jgi:hypothetical protein
MIVDIMVALDWLHLGRPVLFARVSIIDSYVLRQSLRCIKRKIGHYGVSVRLQLQRQPDRVCFHFSKESISFVHLYRV